MEVGAPESHIAHVIPPSSDDGALVRTSTGYDLIAHLERVLESRSIAAAFGARLVQEGYITVVDFEKITLPELTRLGFKQGHIKKVQQYKHLLHTDNDSNEADFEELLRSRPGEQSPKLRNDDQQNQPTPPPKARLWKRLMTAFIGVAVISSISVFVAMFVVGTGPKETDDTSRPSDPFRAATSMTSMCAGKPVGTLCDDSNIETTGDNCQGAPGWSCIGEVALVSSVTFNIAIDEVDLAALDIGDGPDVIDNHPIASSAKQALARTLSAAGMQCVPSDLTVLSINAGSLVIDYVVRVLPMFATPNVRADAVAAIADPASVGLVDSAMAIVVETADGSEILGSGATTDTFTSYSWSLSNVCPQCSTRCGMAAKYRPGEGHNIDEYECMEDGRTNLPHICRETIGAPPQSYLECCPATPPCDDSTSTTTQPQPQPEPQHGQPQPEPDDVVSERTPCITLRYTTSTI